MAQPTLPVVQTVGLTKVFRDFWRRPRVAAVKDLDFEIRPGEVFGLLGPNGSGKSTTIKMILGLLHPTRGRISVFGRPPTDVAIKSRLGYLPEESYLYRFLDARETLDFYGRLFRQHGRVRRDRVNMLLEMVGLQHEAKRRIGEYSKGMARRIGLAQALINDPEFLILDEPTSGLDPLGTRQIKDVIRRLGDMGKTILLSSHLLADVEDVCDRVCILYGGQVRATGPIDALLNKSDQTQITSGHLSEATVEQLRRIIAEREGGEVAVSAPRERLESLFLKIVHEAQVAQVATSGVGQTGAIPEFLGTSTSTGADIIRSLLDAGTEPPPTLAEPTMHAPPLPDGSEQVIADLLDRSPTGAPGQPEPADTPAPRQRPAADVDQNVIDNLLGGDKDT